MAITQVSRPSLYVLPSLFNWLGCEDCRAVQAAVAPRQNYCIGAWRVPPLGAQARRILMGKSTLTWSIIPKRYECLGGVASQGQQNKGVVSY